MTILGAPNDKKYKALEEFGNFINADKVEYIDNGNGEQYFLHKNNKKFEIRVNGNRFDGGYANFYSLDE